VSGELLGRRLLRLDAVYCAGAGAIVAGAAGPLSRLFNVPALLLVALGIWTIAWAVLVGRLARLPTWRTTVARIAVANAAAAAAIAVLAALSPELAARLLLAAVALEVGGFAAGQAVALRR
jgi:hypothetical protein